ETVTLQANITARLERWTTRQPTGQPGRHRVPARRPRAVDSRVSADGPSHEATNHFSRRDDEPGSRGVSQNTPDRHHSNRRDGAARTAWAPFDRRAHS